MRQPRLIGASAAAAVLAGSVIAGGTAALAETPSADPAGTPPAPTAVTLPTGDRVTVMPNGATAIDPAPGREDTTFITPTSPSGDIVVVPTDRVAAIEAGDEDPRRYNVSELLDAGQTDAASATESELDDREYVGLVPDTSSGAEATAEDDLQKLYVTLRDRDGEAPDGSWMLWAARDGSDFGSIPIEENGEGGTVLPPGDYVIVSGFWSDATETERGRIIMGMTPVTIEDTFYDLVLDGGEAQPVSVDVEQEDARFLNAAMVLDARHAEANLGYGNYLGPQDDAFLLPEPDLPEFDLGFIYQPVLASPEGAEDPYVYNLAFHEVGGFPDDTAFSVDDDDLATVQTDYGDLGVAYDGQTCDYGDYTERQIGMGFCRLIDTAVPSQRTMYYTADPGTVWDNQFVAGERDEYGDLVNGFVANYERVFEPGATERVMPRGGLSSGVPAAYRVGEDGVNYFGAETMPVGGGNDEELFLVGAKGTATLSRDGETIAAAEGLDFYWETLFAEMPEGDAGRYTLTADVTQSSPASVFGTDATATWEFDSAPAEDGEFDDIALPVVQLTADDIEGGYGERGACQEITLDLRSYEYGPVVHAVDMAFEISYNDGRTWKKIGLDRDGDSATAEIDHPRSARWVSVRMTATDDAGTEVVHTTIRAYGLK
ncbi:hypothetical protein K3N28_11125 [Glycomyces sp. TRM65418]|uniref:hypothetical protein n=1 Tax=Glycomyces sp. TRM65418 TaxID=2867006 RepID=UPI001CE6363C|nr:hypothetical protein [Glycomyces sp. TRM65418]MCC3763624.1 hypothetical protein [Glycomyces sp. TRM65418]QZD57606.1 hypothetical protein K3N28_11065 [Glycomyces sp. TRM65418]